MINPNWLSIKDKLPEKNQVGVAFYPDGNEMDRLIDTTIYYGGNKLTDEGSSVSYCFVATDWAELPSPPL